MSDAPAYMVPILVMGFRCLRCAHEWVPRQFKPEPKVCPKCKSPYWNRQRLDGAPSKRFAAATASRPESRDSGPGAPG
jgi:hypothetical protein